VDKNGGLKLLEGGWEKGFRKERNKREENYVKKKAEKNRVRGANRERRGPSPCFWEKRKRGKNKKKGWGKGPPKKKRIPGGKEVY